MGGAISRPEDTMWNAIILGDLTGVKKFVNSDGDINEISDDFTPVMLAANCGHKAIVEYLIKSGASITIVNTISGATVFDCVIKESNSIPNSEIVAAIVTTSILSDKARDLKQFASKEGKGLREPKIQKALSTQPRAVIGLAMIDGNLGKRLIDLYNGNKSNAGKEISANDFLGIDVEEGVALFKKITEMVDFYESYEEQSAAKVESNDLFLRLVNEQERDSFFAECEGKNSEELFSILQSKITPSRSVEQPTASNSAAEGQLQGSVSI